jgi:hypothetical protein
MPLIQKTVYIREEDVPAWKALKNKAAFIHEALSGVPGDQLRRKSTFREAELADTPTSQADIDSKVKMVQKEKGLRFCKNGHAIPKGRTKCMGKGCKYA